jgi:biopolymer transport protein ExbD
MNAGFSPGKNSTLQFRTFSGTKPRPPVSKKGMDPFRSRTLIAPAMASLFLVLSLCAFVVQRPESVGMQIPLLPLHPEAHPSGNCNARELVLWLTQDGKMWINDYEQSPDKLRGKIADIMENRYYKNLYIVADSGVSYGKFADFLSRIVGASPDLHVVLLSGQLRREVEQGPTFEGLCIFESPESQSP